MKTKYLVTNVFQWITALMKITVFINCVPMKTASSSSQEIDEDRLRAKAVLQYLCKDWSAFRMKVPYKSLETECNGKCGKGKAFLLPDKETLICYTREEKAEVIFRSEDTFDKLECECGSVLYGSNYEGGQRKTSCENIPYRIKTKKEVRLSCKTSCSTVTMFTTIHGPNRGLKWCDERETNSVFNSVKLRGVVEGEKYGYKCWCGLAIDDIQPSVAPMPTAGMDYWLLEGLKPSRDLNEKVTQTQGLKLISNLSSNNSRKQETLGGTRSDNIGSSTQDVVKQVSKETCKKSGLKYYNFLVPSSPSRDKLRITNPDEDMADDNSMKSRGRIPSISKEEFQMSVKSSRQEIARNKKETEIIKTSTHNVQSSIASVNHKTRNHTPENKALAEKDLKLSLELSTHKLGCNNTKIETYRKLPHDQQFGGGSSIQIMGQVVPETEALATLGSDLHLGLGLGSQKMPRNSNYEQRVNIPSISNCYDFLSLKPSSQYNIGKNVSSIDSNRKKDYQNHDDENLLRYKHKKQRQISPGSFIKSKGNSTHSLLSIVKPIPIIGIGGDNEVLRYDLKSNLGGDKELRCEGEKETASRVPVELMPIEKDVRNLKIGASVDKMK